MSYPHLSVNQAQRAWKMWRTGQFDTARIAEQFCVEEALVYNTLHQIRERRRADLHKFTYHFPEAV